MKPGNTDIYRYLYIIFPLLALLGGCSASRENTYNTQEDRIDKYLSSVTASITYPGTSYRNYWDKEDIISMTAKTEENAEKKPAKKRAAKKTEEKSFEE